MPKYGEWKVVPKPTWSIRSFLIVDVIPKEEAAKVFDWLESRRVEPTWLDIASFIQAALGIQDL